MNKGTTWCVSIVPCLMKCFEKEKNYFQWIGKTYFMQRPAKTPLSHIFMYMLDSPYQYDITCQYNSNVLTLVAVTYHVAGLFDVSEVC